MTNPPIDLNNFRAEREQLTKDERLTRILELLHRTAGRAANGEIKSLVVVELDYNGCVSSDFMATYHDLTTLIGGVRVAEQDLIRRVNRERGEV